MKRVFYVESDAIWSKPIGYATTQF